jgi:hypothetical protein
MRPTGRFAPQAIIAESIPLVRLDANLIPTLCRQT